MTLRGASKLCIVPGIGQHSARSPVQRRRRQRPQPAGRGRGVASSNRPASPRSGSPLSAASPAPRAASGPRRRSSSSAPASPASPAAYELQQSGITPRSIYEASDPPRRPLLDAARRLRRRADLRARRRADRPPGTPTLRQLIRELGSSSITCSRPRRTGTEELGYFRRLLLIATARRPTTSRRSGRSSTQRPYRRQLSDPVGQLHDRARSSSSTHVDRRLDQRDVPGGIARGSGSCSTSPTTSSTAPSRRSRAR